MIEPAPFPASEKPESTIRNRLNRPLAGTLILSALLLAVTVKVDSQGSLPGLRADWILGMPLAQLTGMLVVFWICGTPRRPFETVRLVCLNLILLVCPVLLALDRFGLVSVLLLEIALRIGVVSVWLGAAAGPVLLIVTIYKGRLRWHSAVPVLFVVTASSLLIVVVVEPVALLIDKTNDRPLSLPQSLPDPPSGEIHVAVFGGSTMLGRPYQPRYGIGEVLRWQLTKMYPETKVILHNLARGGANLKSALDRVSMLKVRPHLVLLYSGHNESFHGAAEMGGNRYRSYQFADQWLNKSPMFRSFDAALAKRSTLRQAGLYEDHFCGDHLFRPAVAAARLRRFEQYLKQLADFGRTNGIPMVWFVPAAAELTFEPNLSTPARGTGMEEKKQLEILRAQGLRLESSGQIDKAIACYRESLQRHPQLAEFHYRLGLCLYEQQKFDAARQHLQAALDSDGYPIRATLEYRSLTARVAQQNQIPLIDAAEILRPHTSHGILDASMFHDSVHPTLRAYFLLGCAAGKIVDQRRLIPESFGTPAAHPSEFSDSIAATQVDLSLLKTAYGRTDAGLTRLAWYRFEDAARRKNAQHYGLLVEMIESGRAIPGKDGVESLGENPDAGR